ncbi:MAG: histidine kinase [Anaerolineae bacterium]
MISLRRLRGLRVQILLWTILPLILILVAISFTGVYSHQRAMRALVLQRDARLVSVAASDLAEHLAGRLALLQMLAQAEPRAISLQPPPAAVVTAFDGGVTVVDSQGAMAAAYPSAEAWAPRWPMVLSLAQAVRAKGQPGTSSIIEDEALGQPAVLMAVSEAEDGLVVVGAASLERLQVRPMMSALAAGPRAVAYLVDGEGRVLWHSDATQRGEDLGSQAGVAAVRQGVAGATIDRTPGGEEMVVGYAPVAPAGWGLIVQEPWGDVVGPMMRYSLITPVIVMVATVVSLLAIFFGVQRIIRPLQELDQQASRMAWGDFTATQNAVGGVREIEDLRHTLNHMAEQIQRYRRGMQSYIAAITRGQEEERKRLARELHDDTAQSLIALTQRIEMAHKALDRDPAQAAARLVELKEMATAALQNVRRFSRDLRPLYLEDLGLVPALEMLVRDAEKANSLQATFQMTGSPQRLVPELELAIFRIAQEALNNVAQHARASRVEVRLDFAGEGVTLSVEDDGLGFDAPEMPHELASLGHFGLMGMRERALLFGGHLSIRSRPGRGTKVVAYLPR